MPNVLADDGEMLIGIQIVHASAKNRIDQALQTPSNKTTKLCNPFRHILLLAVARIGNA